MNSRYALSPHTAQRNQRQTDPLYPLVESLRRSMVRQASSANDRAVAQDGTRDTDLHRWAKGGDHSGAIQQELDSALDSSPQNCDNGSSLLASSSALDRDIKERQDHLMSKVRSYLYLMLDGQRHQSPTDRNVQSDIVQQACLRIATKLPDFRGASEGELRKWFFQILLNEIKGERRRTFAQKRDVRRERRFGDSQGSATDLDAAVDRQKTPRSAAIASEHTESLRKAIQQLPAELREVIQLRNWDGLSFPQIAAQLCLSTNAVEKRWYRAIKRLKQVTDLDVA